MPVAPPPPPPTRGRTRFCFLSKFPPQPLRLDRGTQKPHKYPDRPKPPNPPNALIQTELPCTKTQTSTYAPPPTTNSSTWPTTSPATRSTPTSPGKPLATV